MTSPTITNEVEQYLDEVRMHLADLSDEDRADLLEDLRQHLSDIGSEENGSPLQDRLGEPSAYADELRVAAGLAPRSPIEGQPGHASLTGRLREGLTALREVVFELRPAWWVLRGAVLAALPFWWKPDGNDDFPVPSPFGMPVLGALIVVLGVAASVWLGRSADRSAWRRVGIAANAVLLIGLFLGSMVPRNAVVAPSITWEPFLLSRHGPVTNIYPYDSAGRPLEGVLLYDQDGRPLRVDFQHWWADRCQREPEFPRAADGVPVEFSYPRKYKVTNTAEFGEMFDGRPCTAEIPRPPVPIPQFPSPAEGPTPAP